MKTIILFFITFVGSMPSFASSPIQSDFSLHKFNHHSFTIPHVYTESRKNIFQKIFQKVVVKRIKKKNWNHEDLNKKRRQGRFSMVLGIASVVLLTIPAGLWFALPAALGGLIFGIKSVNGNSNVEGIIGLVSSGVTLSVFLIVGLVSLIVVLNGN